MRKAENRYGLIALAALLAVPAQAQREAAPPPVSDDDEGSIVVNGKSAPLPGAVVGDIPAELQYSPADIRAYGVSSVSDLLNELAPEIRSDRGRGSGGPVVLLNGRRISGFTEIRDIPTEAILRVDILPEEVALKYGYSADQRVVNIVLRRRFRALTTQADGTTTTDGGAASGVGDIDLLRIHGGDRLNLDAKYTDTARLTEAQRDIVSTGTAADGSAVDLAPYRTIAPSNRALALNSVLAHPLSRTVSATINGTFDYGDSGSLRGLPTTSLDGTRYSIGTDPLHQDVRTLAGHLGTTVNADVAKWRLSFTAGYDHGDTSTHIETGPDARATAQATSNAGNVQFVGNGPLLDLPAGPLATSVKLGWTTTAYDTRSDRSGLRQDAHLSRRDASAQLNVDVPLASRSRDILPWLGTLSANFNIAGDRYSDFGTETTLGYGLNWTPQPQVTLIASTTHDHGIPSVQQLADPVVTTPQVRVFDYLTGQTVDVAETGGGNPDLTADSRHVDKLGLTVKPVKALDLTLTANYVRSDIRNAIAAFPAPTSTIELAFPDRFTRDADGDLDRIDVRALNFARERRQELRWGINFTQKIKTSQALIDAYRALRASGALQRPGGGGPGGGGPGGGYGGGNGGGGRGAGGAGGFGGRGGAQQGGRLQVSVYHTWYFRDDILVRNGGPTLDLLDGGTTGTGGGQPRHQVDLQLGLTMNGIGARMTGTWQSPTTVTGGTGAAADTLRFSGLATANFRLFVDLGQQPALLKHRWARGARVTLAVTNLLDTRQRVRDATGATPLAYQPDYLDPLGRTIRISVRKLFF